MTTSVVIPRKAIADALSFDALTARIHSALENVECSELVSSPNTACVINVHVLSESVEGQRFLRIANNEDLRTLQRGVESISDEVAVKVSLVKQPPTITEESSAKNEGSESGTIPLVRAQDDLDVPSDGTNQNFDVNRSYSNDGRLVAVSRSVTSRLPLQSVPTCSSLSQSSQLRQKKSTTFLWRFRKELLIGAGADGKVYLSRDLKTNERIAVKEILISPSAHRTLQEAQEDSRKIAVMKRQIDALRKLPNHSNVVQHLGAERTTCALNVMMEYVAGGSISALLAKLGAFSERVVRIYTRHICSALAFLHQHDVIHRDIKGANCLVGVDGAAKVCDFGCCVMGQLEGGSGGAQKGIHGTSMWMSPECIQSLKITAKTDIWSLGCTIVEMATGKPPWHEAHFTNEWAAMFHISQAKRGPPIPAHLSRQAHEFLKRCFNVDPEARPTADECLAHPFLSEEFEVNSGRPEMQPPTPTDWNTPFLPSSSTWSDEAHSSTDYEASNYSSFTQGGAVYDQEWGDAETAVEEEPIDLAGVCALTPGELPTPSPDQTFKKSEVSLEVIDTFLRGNQTHNPTPPPTVSSESTDDRRHEHVLDDEYGFGLPEPILFTVFSFVDARSLCVLACTSRNLRDMVENGAKEILWKSLFLRVFGDVDVVQLMLRKNWKTYFKNSFLNHGIVIDDRYKVIRQHGPSDRVYDGVDVTSSSEKVIIKMERWHVLSSAAPSTAGSRLQRLPASQYAPLSSVASIARAPSPSRDPPPCNVVRLPTLLRTPTKQKSTTPLSQQGRPPAPPPPAVFSPHKERSRSDDCSFERLSPAVVGGNSLVAATGSSRPPLSRVGNAASTSPQKARVVPTQPQPPPPQQLSSAQFPNSGSFARGRTLPRNSRLPSPSQFAVPTPSNRRTSSPYYRDGATPPTHFVFLQPSALFRQPTCEAAGSSTHQDSPDRSNQNDHPTACPFASQRTVSSGQRTATAEGTMHGTLTLNATLLRDHLSATKAGGGWHDIYDFQRTSELAPLAGSTKHAHKSLLQHDFRFLRHLEALGARCIPRILTYHDNDTEAQRNVLVTSMMGPSLNELLLFCGNQLTLRTLSLLTLRLLDALEEMHDRDVVHGNISPSNIVVGANHAQHDKFFFINFAHARFFRDPRTHRPTNTSTSSTNAERAQKHNEFLSFCSTFVQRRCTAAPRDDIIALGYVLCYLFHGGLPWTREKTLNVADLLRQKNAYLESLQRTPPIQLHYFLKSGYALRQGEVPDYRYLKSLVSRMMEEKKWVDDGVFDWSAQLRVVTAESS